MPTRTIDLTPTWAAVVRPMLEAHAHNTHMAELGTISEDGRTALDGLRQEFAAMARAADERNELAGILRRIGAALSELVAQTRELDDQGKDADPAIVREALLDIMLIGKETTDEADDDD